MVEGSPISLQIQFNPSCNSTVRLMTLFSKPKIGHVLYNETGHLKFGFS